MSEINNTGDDTPDDPERNTGAENGEKSAGSQDYNSNEELDALQDGDGEDGSDSPVVGKWTQRIMDERAGAGEGDSQRAQEIGYPGPERDRGGPGR